MRKSDEPRSKGLPAGAIKQARRRERLRKWTLLTSLHGTPEEQQRAADVESLLDRSSRDPQSPIRVGEVQRIGNRARISPIPGVGQETATPLTYVKGSNGVRAKPGFSDHQLRTSYKSLSADLAEVRTVVIQSEGKISVSQLMKDFKNREISKAADKEHWQGWIKDFWEKKARPKAVTLVYLESITGVPRRTLRTRVEQEAPSDQVEINHSQQRLTFRNFHAIP